MGIGMLTMIHVYIYVYVCEWRGGVVERRGSKLIIACAHAIVQYVPYMTLDSQLFMH